MPRISLGRQVVALAWMLLALSSAGCGKSGRDSYVKANERVFSSLPRFPGARLTSETSVAYSGEDGSRALGYVTRYELRLRAGADAWSFFTRRLQPEWLWVETLDGPVLNFRRGRAFVSIDLASRQAHVLEVAVDHEYYGKLGRCGTPGGCDGPPAWREIRDAILGCHARAVGQTHARDVSVTLENGRMLRGKEPAIDDVLDVINASRCGSPPAFATE